MFSELMNYNEIDSNENNGIVRLFQFIVFHFVSVDFGLIRSICTRLYIGLNSRKQFLPYFFLFSALTVFNKN